MFPVGGGGTVFALSCFAEGPRMPYGKGWTPSCSPWRSGAMIQFVLVITPADIGEEANDRQKERSSTMSVIGGKFRFKQDTIFFC